MTSRPDSSAPLRRAGRRAPRGQSGVSLVEVLIGIGVMVPMTLAAITGLMLTIRTSDATEVRQRLEVTLSTTTEDLKSVPYLQCGTAEEYQELYQAWSTPLEAELVDAERPTAPVVTDVRYWNRGKDAFTDSCGGDDGAQQLTVTVMSRGSSVTGTVVIRDEDARVGNSG